MKHAHAAHSTQIWRIACWYSPKLMCNHHLDQAYRHAQLLCPTRGCAFAMRYFLTCKGGDTQLAHVTYIQCDLFNAITQYVLLCDLSEASVNVLFGVLYPTVAPCSSGSSSSNKYDSPVLQTPRHSGMNNSVEKNDETSSMRAAAAAFLAFNFASAFRPAWQSTHKHWEHVIGSKVCILHMIAIWQRIDLRLGD